MEALNEADERFGNRIDPEDSALADYEGETLEARLESALNCGDARYNDGGTLVWVDPYEWVRTYRSGRALHADLKDWKLKGIPVIVL